MTLKKAKEKKKMKTRSNMPLFVLECSDITKLTDGQIDLLHCGDYLVKKTGKQRHAYKVTYKEDKKGICLTYHDASTVETVSYDYTGGHWVYNSTDKSQLPLKDGDVYTFDGDLAVFENIVDKDGHKRFIEGNITSNSLPEGATALYGKWALSGNHLLIVLAVSAPDTTIFPSSALMGECSIPKWIYDKIVNLYASNVLQSAVTWYNDDYTTQGSYAYVRKASDNKLQIINASLTLTKDRVARITFDLLIDNE